MGPSKLSRSGATSTAVVNNIWKNRMPIPDRGCILNMTHISKTNQFAISTSDLFISYWDTELNRLCGFERMDRAQVRLQQLSH